MELLVIKTGNQYIRIEKDDYFVCGIEKASVFPLSKIESVYEYIGKIKNKNFKDIHIKKLVISEEPFNQN